MATKKSSSGGRFLPFVLGFVFALLALVVGGWVYLKYGNPPVAAADPAFPFEAQVVHVPLGARIAKELQQPPFPASEDAFEAGAHVYKENCAACHGSPGQDIAFAKNMYPSAPQLFKPHKQKSAGTPVVGVSDDEPGETYWKVKNGIRLTGMPAFQKTLSDSEMWDVSLLLKNADQPLPDPVAAILKAK
jgi:mono/diheme cytochrome c family protein